MMNARSKILFVALLVAFTAMTVYAGVTIQPRQVIVQGGAYGGLTTVTLEDSITFSTGADTSAPFNLHHNLGDNLTWVPDSIMFVIQYTLVTATDDSVCVALVKLETRSEGMDAGDTWVATDSFVSAAGANDSMAVTEKTFRSYLTGMNTFNHAATIPGYGSVGRIVFAGAAGGDATNVVIYIYPFDVGGFPVTKRHD